MRYLKNFNLFESKTTHANKELIKLISWAIDKLGCTTKKIKNGLMLYPPKHLGTDHEPRTIHLSERAIFDVMRAVAKWYGLKKKDIEEAFENNFELNKKY